MDASILNEAMPDIRDPELNLYDPANANQPPYTAAFVARYRAAQIARNRRITAWVRDRLAALKAAGRTNGEHAFVVHGTMTDPRWLDPSLEPNGRKPGWCYLGDPRVVNDGPVGLARFTTLRSWLSQWSFDEAHGDGPKSAAAISIPAMLIANGADDACTPSHNDRLFDPIPHGDKERHTIAGANHYYFDQPNKLAEAVGLITDWLGRKGFR